MRESVLHYLWKFRKLKTQRFSSVDRQTIEVIHPGIHNHASGPDFLNARINVNGIEWNGHVEIHVHSSEWEKHHHQHDPAYDNVILHVVYHCDQPVFTHSGIELIQAEIKELVKEDDLKNALTFVQNEQPIACLNQLKYVDVVTIRSQKERSLFNRLESCLGFIENELQKNRNDWEQLAWKLIARAFGTNLNKHAFERLPEILPLNIIRKEGYSLMRTEALLFHYSGLTKQVEGSHAAQLRETAQQFSVKYNMGQMGKQEWKFSPLRPPNFPTVRMAQLAAFVFEHTNLFSAIVESKTTGELIQLFRVNASEYWKTHYTFSETGAGKGSPNTSVDFIYTLIINAAIPLLFAWGRYRGDETMTERCIEILETIPAEKNSLVDTFYKAGVEVKSAFDSQALIELKNNFCAAKKCLSCSIGLKIISKQ